MKKSDVKAAAKARFWADVAPVMVSFWTAVKRAFWAALAWLYVAAKYIKAKWLDFADYVRRAI